MCVQDVVPIELVIVFGVAGANMLTCKCVGCSSVLPYEVKRQYLLTIK